MGTLSNPTESLARRVSSRIAELAAAEGGSVLIETTIAYTVMATCVLGILGFALMVYTYSVYQEAARNGVRYAIVHGSDSSNCSGPTTGCGDQSGANVVDAVTSYASPYTASIDGLRVVVSYPDSGGCTPPSRVIVTVTYTYKPLFKPLPTGLAFQVSSQGRIVY